MQHEPHTSEPVELFIIGGGVNGCGIARDAAGRGLSVTLAKMNDLASATSSTSTKLFHGGLRYLEYFEINLVRHALKEREVLLRAMPHIAWPMRFVLPYHPDMRFEGETPASKVLSVVMPWMRGRRPAWMIRFGLFLYDHLGGREILPATKTLKLRDTAEGAPLDARFERAFEYSDCWIEDSRLVVLNARDARNHGAQIMTQTKVVSAARVGDLVAAQTGLLLDPYFSGTKLKWILDHHDGARQRARAGKLKFGTVDSWLIWNLTNGGDHVTDATNAARTMLYDIHKGEWSSEICILLDIPMEMLPQVHDYAADFGIADATHLGAAIPILGVAGDQQAATVGQACFGPGMMKSTYGTGCFALLNTGASAVLSQNRLLTTIAYQLDGVPTYALEGSILSLALLCNGCATDWV